MRYIQYFFKNIHLLNVILILAIVFLAQYTALPFQNTTSKINLSAKKQAPITQAEKPAVAQSPSLSDFLTIADQNLFHPDRTIPVQKVSVPLPDIILYGVSITDSESVAYVEDKKSQRTTTGRGKRQTVLRKGNTIGGFTLKNIEPDRIELVKGEERMVVYLTDSRKPKERGESAKASALLPQTPAMAAPAQMAAPSPSQSPPAAAAPSVRGRDTSAIMDKIIKRSAGRQKTTSSPSGQIQDLN